MNRFTAFVDRRFPLASLTWQKRFALLVLLTQAGICVTGATVRVTASGLGCNTWPQCHPGSFTPVAGAAPWIHQAVEFGNRLLTFVLIAVAALLVLSVIRARRRSEVMLLSWLMPAGIVVQAVVGGITVLLGLAWWIVAIHMLLSLLLVFLAGILYVRIGEPDDGRKVAVLPQNVRLLLSVMVALLILITVTGTMVTGAGPHAGDARIAAEDRLQIPIVDIARIHAFSLYAFVGLLVLLGVILYKLQVPAELKRTFLLAAGITIAQGLVGITQYLTGVPEALVVIHVGGSAAVSGLFAILYAKAHTRTDGSVTKTGSTRTPELANVR